MPYKMCFRYTNGSYGEIKPLANNNPSRGPNDERIYYKCQGYAKKMEKSFDDLEECYVAHYED